MKMGAKKRVVSLAVAAALLPFLAMTVSVMILRGPAEQKAAEELDLLARASMAQLAEEIAALCENTYKMQESRAQLASHVALTLIAEEGGIEASGDFTADARDSLSGTTVQIMAPRLLLGGQPWAPAPVSDGQGPIPVVDRVFSLFDAPFSVYTRTESGGMYCALSFGPRAGDRLGVYLPPHLRTGKENPLLQEILAGKSHYQVRFDYQARESVLFQPLKDAQGRVVGMLGIDAPSFPMDAVYKTIVSTRIGNSGYVWVITAQGENQGRYVISDKGADDGRNVLESRDREGRFIIREMINQAEEKGPGEISFYSYPWKKPNESQFRDKVAAITVFKPWNWVIGAGLYLDDFQEAKTHMARAMDRMIFWMFVSGGVILILVLILALALGGRIARPYTLATRVADAVASGELGRARRELSSGGVEPGGRAEKNADESSLLLYSLEAMVGELEQIIGQVQRSGIQVHGATTQITASSRQLEAAVAEQSASTRQVSSASGLISERSQDLVHKMEEVSEAASVARDLAEEGAQGLENMVLAMRQLMAGTGTVSGRLSAISRRADDIGDIVTTIDKVADQTNLLSLNAAIEAEKAGEAGMGFSVVAREIQRLADQSGASAEDIGRLIHQMQSAVASGVMEMDKFIAQVNREVAGVEAISARQNQLIDSVKGLYAGFDQVHETMQEQDERAGEITTAMDQLAETVDQTRQSCGEFETAASRLADAVDGLREMVGRVKVD